MPQPTDTICAIATPPGAGGLGIVRLSGPAVTDIARQLVGRLPPPRHAMLADFRDADGEVIDTGIALYFPAPRSFTGEDVLELQGHGGTFILQRAGGAGARAGRTAGASPANFPSVPS